MGKKLNKFKEYIEEYKKFNHELENPEKITGNWTCVKCTRTYPNTLRWCPHCKIAAKHSENVRIGNEKKGGLS